jgi:hypothetical protein
MTDRKQVEVNKARVRAVLRRLKKVKCENFRVVGAGQWKDQPRMRYLKPCR